MRIYKMFFTRNFSKKVFPSGAQASCLPRLREQSKKFRLTSNLSLIEAFIRAIALNAGKMPALPAKNQFDLQQIKKVLFIFILIISQTASVLPFGLHRFHTSLTRIDYNAKEKLVEITVQVFLHDLISVLKSKDGKPIDLEKTPNVDRIIFDYFNANFVLTDAKGETKTLRWIGKEADADSVRIYVETDSAADLEGYKLKNTVFFESFPEQTNLVVCRYDGRRADLLFKVGDKIKEIKGSEK